MSPHRYRIRRAGGPLKPWSLFRSDPVSQWVRLDDFADWDAAMRYANRLVGVR